MWASLGAIILLTTGLSRSGALGNASGDEEKWVDWGFILGADQQVLADGWAVGLKALSETGREHILGWGCRSRGFLGHVYFEMPTRQSSGNIK